ncbi:hypothetical protein EBB07_05270 [Paenibacillaceae bacterium]|nr:hypothetical protein EBB07_05270 [Paenibacillaceae bacterium]
MHAKHAHEASIFKKTLLIAMAFILVLMAAPITPALADAKPESLPIYVGWQKFAHTGSTANVSNDSTRVLNFPINPGRFNAATTFDGRLRVVPVTNDSSGIVVRTNKIKLDGGFSTYFVMHLNGSTSLDLPSFPGPADGLTFIIQDNPTPHIGGVGEGVGYAGIPNSIGVEFDTWRNYGVARGVKYEDPNLPFNRLNKYHPTENPSGPTADHVALVMNGNNHHGADSGDVIDDLQGANFRLYDYGATNAYIHVWVDYNEDGLLTTTYGLSANRSDANNRDLTRDVGKSLMNKEVYVGFGASTGGANSHHDILAWYFKNSYVEGGLDPNGDYEQGPSAVTINKVVSEVGTETGIDIKVNGTSTSDNLPNESVDIYINDQLIEGEYSTNSEGVLVYNFDDSSNLQVGNNTITVVSRSGGTSSTASVVQTEAPLADDLLLAYTTDGIVTVDGVPNGVVVTLYDENNEVIATSPITTNGTARFELTGTDKDKITDDSEIKISYSRTGEVPSNTISVTPTIRSNAPEAESISTNATNNTVTIKDVPAGAIVKVYDEDGEVIGTATNNEDAEAVVVVIIASPPGLDNGDRIAVTITEDDKLESERVSSEAKLASDPLDADNIETNATDNKVTIKDVPPGATINVYDDNGEIIGTATNPGSSADIVIEINPPHVLKAGDIIKVTVTETGKLESEPVSTQTKQESEPPDNSTVEASVSRGSVTVEEVPDGATIIIYDEDGTELKREVNPGPGTGTVVIDGLALEPGTKIQVTITEEDKLESKPLIIDVEFTADEAIDDALRKLQIGYSANDTWESVTLPVLVVTTGANDTTIEWTSSKPDAIEITLSASETVETIVHRGKKDESVILTASVSKNGATKTRTFLLIVKAENLTKTTVENYRQVNVTGGSSDEVNEQVGIDRISLSNGVKIDKAIFDPAAAGRFVNDPRTKDGVSTVYVDEIKDDEPDEIAVEIPGQSVGLLNNNGNSLNIRTEYTTLSIAGDVLGQMAGSHLDLFFRLIPVKDAGQQAVLNNSIVKESVVRTAAGSRAAEVIGFSLKIETNYRDYETTLFLPFAKNGITVPASNASSFLNSLRVFVEHSDGEKVVKRPTVVYDGNTPIGLEIKIDKFSVFSIIQLKDIPTYEISVPNVLPVPNVPTDSPETEQVKTAIIDMNEGTIVLELVDGSGGVDKSGFVVKIGDKTMDIEDIRIDGNQVIIKLKDRIPAGYEATVSYKPGSVGSNGALQQFTNLVIANPGHHIAYIKGFPDGNFRPENTITRAEMSTILARTKNLTDHYAYQQLYPDVADGFWAAAYIEQLQETGLLIGDKEGNFRPSDRITRAEIAMVAARWLNADLDGSFVNAFEDVSDKHWAAAAIAAVSEAGVMIGFEDGTFGLEKYVTRAQAVTIMNRLLGRGPLTGVPTPTWPDVLPAHWASEHIEEASQDHYYTYLPDGRERLFKQ